MSGIRLPHALYLASQVRELDRRAIQEHGLPGYELMCRAGAACLRELRARWADAKRIAVLCGAGNNAGDGYVVARLALEAGLQPLVLTLAPPENLRGDAHQAWLDAMMAEVEITAFSPSHLENGDVVVDALLGTGLQREVAGEWAHAIAAINALGSQVLAVDIPSGLSADTGAVLGVAVHANVTVSFIGLKQGLFSGQARDYCGDIRFDDLGVPDAVFQGLQPSAIRYEGEDLPQLLPPRARITHKGRCGHVLVVGGDTGMGGAARMAGEAAARVGAGLVSIATRPEHAGMQAALRPELMFHGVADPGQLAALVSRASVLAVGPGLGRSEWGRDLFAWALSRDLPMVIDADGLNFLAGRELTVGPRVLTPHPGEAARLLGWDVDRVESDRFTAARSIQQHYQSLVVLKGAGTLVCCAQAEAVSVCQSGNPGMASGGMGDVLTGVIAGLAAQGLTLSQAARAGAWLHGAAADQAAADGERGLLATELFPHLRRLVNPL